jgi:PTH1 family peptidyl-tRNA hydrolase
VPHFLTGDMEQATRLIHTSKPIRPKPPRSAKSPSPMDCDDELNTLTEPKA